MYVSTLPNSLTSRIERGISPRRAAKEQKTTQISKTRLRHGKKLLCYTVFLYRSLTHVDLSFDRT